MEGDGADLPVGVRLHPDASREPNAVREWSATVLVIVLVIVLMIALIPLTLWVKSINDQFAAAQARNGAFEVFLHQFTAEENYKCRVLWEINHADANISPPPSPTICNVQAP